MKNVIKANTFQLYFYLLLIGLVFLFQNCHQDDSTISEENQISTELSSKPSKSNGKVDVCHYNEDTNDWHMISISINAVPAHLGYRDVIIDEDGDGYAVFNECNTLNDNGIDCNDTDPSINPGAIEICDGIDNNCEGSIDDGLTTIYYADGDNDGFGDLSLTVQTCELPTGYAVNSGDCDDTDPAVYSGAEEICDGVDNNCDGRIDENCTIQERLNNGQTPKELLDSGILLSEIYGKIYQGGFIFYLNTENGTGLLAAQRDYSVWIDWDDGNNIFIGGTGAAIGTGQTNTTAIVAAQGEGNYAALVCDNYDDGTYSDWFLPSIDELKAMHTNLYLKGIGNFSYYYYHSSTEYNYRYNWILYFTAGGQRTYYKNFTIPVRAARAF